MTKLADLAENVANVINAAPDDTWSDLKVGTESTDYVKAVPALDPITKRSKAVKGLYVLPVVLQFSRDSSQGRQQIVKLSKQPVISICLSIPIAESSTDGIDITSWEEVKQLLNLREEIDTYVLKQPWTHNILSITAEPPQEIALDVNWMLTITEIEFEGFSC